VHLRAWLVKGEFDKPVAASGQQRAASEWSVKFPAIKDGRVGESLLDAFRELFCRAAKPVEETAPRCPDLASSGNLVEIDAALLVEDTIHFLAGHFFGFHCGPLKPDGLLWVDFPGTDIFTAAVQNDVTVSRVVALELDFVSEVPQFGGDFIRVDFAVFVRGLLDF